MIDPTLEELLSKIQTKGQLTYCLFFLGRASIECEIPSYKGISEIIACFDDTAHELRRRILDPYEDAAMEANGDVLPPANDLQIKLWRQNE